MKKYLMVVGIFLFIESLAFGDRYVVLFKQEAPSIGAMEPTQVEEWLQTVSIKNMGDMKKWLDQKRASSELVNLWLVQGAVVTLSKELSEKLAKEPFVAGVYSDVKLKLIDPINPLTVVDKLDELDEIPPWGLTRVGLKKIQSEFPHLNGKGVRVGVIDTGIQSGHVEFLASRNKAGAVTFRDFVVSIESPYDDHGHGTHVAGTIAGSQVGLAPQSSLIVAKALSAQGMGYISSLARAMQWVFDPDGDPKTQDFAQVVSNSWGATLSSDGVNSLEAFAPLVRAVDGWVRAGIVPVFAAGNSGAAPNGIPGGFPNAISVGAFDRTDELAPFSSRGPNLWRVGLGVLSLLKPDLSAPGVEVSSAFPGNKYATWSGTSMATPHVTGSIALALQANPKLRFPHIKELLLSTSERKLDLGYGYGMIDAYTLVKQAVSYIPTR